MSAIPTTLPPSRIADPATAPPLRWGILATGGIAEKFVMASRDHTSQRIRAVGSRELSRAEQFAARHRIDRAYGSYEQLVADPEIDVIYVATPHSEHLSAALMAIAAGKHVLVEKPFARNASEAAEILDAAREAGVMAQEAMWTRFLPHIDVVRQLLADGVLGDVSTVFADHGQYFSNMDPAHRLLNPDLAGGALLDLGIYPVSFSSFAIGTAETVIATGTLTAAGVDAQVSALLSCGTQVAVVNTTLLSETPTTASISGSAARLEISGPFYSPAALTMTGVRGGPVLTRPVDPIQSHRGMCFEAAEVARCLADGMTESPLMPASETLSIMRTVDKMRSQVGVVYPGEAYDVVRNWVWGVPSWGRGSVRLPGGGAVGDQRADGEDRFG